MRRQAAGSGQLHAKLHASSCQDTEVAEQPCMLNMPGKKRGCALHCVCCCLLRNCLYLTCPYCTRSSKCVAATPPSMKPPAHLCATVWLSVAFCLHSLQCALPSLWHASSGWCVVQTTCSCGCTTTIQWTKSRRSRRTQITSGQQPCSQPAALQQKPAAAVKVAVTPAATAAVLLTSAHAVPRMLGRAWQQHRRWTVHGLLWLRGWAKPASSMLGCVLSDLTTSACMLSLAFPCA